MNSRRSQLYLAHARPSDDFAETRGEDDDQIADMDPGEAAEYIASLLCSLRAIAVKSHFTLLSDLISVAEEEARFHFPA